MRDIFRVLPCWPSTRYLEFAPRYWRQTRARLLPDEIECEAGWLTVPEPPLDTAKSAPAPSELALAP